MNPRSQAIMSIAVLTGLIPASFTFANGFIDFTTPSIAIQQVDLFGGTPFHINATLSATGGINWHLDVDTNGNTINNDSSLTSLFTGVLPSEFSVLGLAQLPQQSEKTAFSKK